MPMAVAVKSTAHFTARNFRCAKPANNTSRSASARAGWPETIAENVDTSSSAPLCSGRGPTNTLNPPCRGSTGRIADRATTSAAPRRAAAHASAATDSQLDPGTVDSIAASTASRPPVTPHNVVAFVSARCISTNISAAASPSRRQPVQSAGVNPPPMSATSFLHRGFGSASLGFAPHRAGITSGPGHTAVHHACRIRHSPAAPMRQGHRAGPLGVGACPALADDLHAGMRGEPRGERSRFMSGQDIGRTMAFTVRDRSGVRLSVPGGEIIHTQHPACWAADLAAT